MTWKSLVVLGIVAVCGGILPLQADTFKNKQTGETFYGFRTQKNASSQTLVYNDATKKLTPVDLNDYEVTMDSKGRRNSVVMVSITDSQMLLSGQIAETISEAIIKASNTGPQFVLLKIDCPGGRGEYMKQVCAAIAKTDNCKIIAYIPGGTYGGAHSAAAVLALACEKIFMAPAALLSAVGPVTDSSEQDSAQLYSSDNLASYAVFAATLAEQRQRPGLLARALLDKKASIVEVTDTSGKVSLIDKSQRQPTQTITKTICEGYSGTTLTSDQKETGGLQTSDVHSQVLNLTAQEAVRLKLADHIAYSIQDILTEMNVSDVQIANAPGLETVVRQFTAARKNIQQRLTKIEYLEGRASKLDEQLNTLEEQIRTTPAKRTQIRNERNARGGTTHQSRTSTVNDSTYSGYDDNNTGYGRYPANNYENNPDYLQNRNPRSMLRVSNTETITTAEASSSANQTKIELSYVLNDLISEYRQTVTTAKRWSGALPGDITVTALEKKMNTAMSMAENLRYRP